MLKVDLHLHTSEDPSDHILYSAADAIDRAAELGFDALAITLHDAQFESDRLRAHARERGITLIPGVERTIQGRHVLLVNFPARVSMSVSSFADLRHVRRRGDGIVIAPHPFFPGRSCLRGAIDACAGVFDAVEWSYFWARAIDFNAPAAAWAARRGLPLVGNSDMHDIRQIGRTYTMVDAPPDPDAICGAIRRGRVELCTAPVPYHELVRVFGGLMMRGWLGSINRGAPFDRLSTHA
ncbi:MAG TPA: PHP-associated domain-containing protein [Vicinamibacterales bacterium]